MNVYSDNFHTTVNSLAGEALNIYNLLYMSEDLNIRDAEYNLSVSLYPIAGQTLRDLADFYSLVHSFSMLSVSTNYSNITDYANSVIDLIFLGISYVQIIHYIEPNLRWSLYYAPLIVDLLITLENIQVHKKILKQDSEEKVAFLLFISEELS